MPTTPGHANSRSHCLAFQEDSVLTASPRSPSYLPGAPADPSLNSRRRRFLFALGATGAGAAAAAVPAVAVTVAEAGAGPAPKASGYRVTEHIRNYYRSARR